MDGHDPDHMNWQNFLLWLKDHGMDIDKKRFPVEYRYFLEHGRGLAVTRDVLSNEILFTIPTECLVNMDTLFKWSKLKSVTRFTATQLLTSYLALYKADSSNSDTLDFKPYFDTLPVDFHFHPLTWLVLHEPSTALVGLPPAVQRKVFRLRDRFLADRLKIQSKFPQLSEADCLWGWLNVNTRSLYYKCKRAQTHPDNITLCPLLDLANHSFSAPNLNAPSHRRNGHPIPSMIAPPDGLQAGEQLFLLYGHHSNEILFSEYGFTDPSAPKEINLDDAVESMFNDLAECEEKKQLLQERGYWENWTLHAEPEPAQPSYRLIPALRLYHIPITDKQMLQRWENTIAGTLSEVSPQNTKQIRDTLAGLCMKRHSEATKWLSENSEIPGSSELWMLHAWGSIKLLWEQQRDVSALVHESIIAGIEL